ncbi:Uncharacterized protein Rs2_51763 [Raphanus sativus]|nr:Uncharacterized protein Rs2_51763 [Raphanus sativus]
MLGPLNYFHIPYQAVRIIDFYIFQQQQGYVLGNPLTDGVLDGNARIPFAHGKALISDELYDSMKRRCGGNYFNVLHRVLETGSGVQAGRRIGIRYQNTWLITRAYAEHVKGGGHTLEYKPMENSIMFKRWISSQPL